MAEVSQKTKYVKLDDGVSFALVRTNPKLTTNTKLMYNGKKMYMESYASGELLNRTQYKNVSVKSNSTYNKDIANFLIGSGTRAYEVGQNFNDTTISSSYDYQYENMYWCGAEYIDSSFYDEKIGFVAPLYLREKLPNYFVIFRIDTPSNYNLNVDEEGNKLDSAFDFKKDILDKAVLIKTFDLREKSETPLGKYIHNYINNEGFEFDKSIHVNFSNGEVTYYGIDKIEGVFVNRVENFNNELLKNDNTILENDRWFTNGFERNSLIFPYIMNIEYLFDDETFNTKDGETYDFARYIGLYCNTIEFGEFSDLSEFGETEDNAIYYFEDNKNNLHRYVKKIKDIEDGDGIDSGNSDDVDVVTEYEITIDGKDIELFDKNLISGFEKERVTAYAEPLDIYEGFINRAQYGFEILKPFEPGDWVGIEYDGHVECYFADNVNNISGVNQNMKKGEIDGFRFSVGENSTVNDIAETLVKCVNHNKKSKFEAKCSDNFVVFYAKREGKEYNGSEDGGAKMLMESSLIYNRKISLPISNYIHRISEKDKPIEDISDSIISYIGENDYYVDYFCGACDTYVDFKTDTYKNIFKIYTEDCEFFDVNRYLKTNNGDGRRICSNMIYVDVEGKINPEYRIIIVDDISNDKILNSGYDVSVSSTYQVEIMDIFKPNHGVLSWFPVKDFDFDINYSSYGQYGAFVDECEKLSKKLIYKSLYNIKDTYGDSDSYSNLEDSSYDIKKIAKSPFFDDYDNSLETEYDYFLEQYHQNLCLVSKSVPYILKWGYYDDQKDSCENPYRLNVSKVFGVSNLSANTFLNKCDENEYTHNMPYYMTLNKPDYKKEYQYIETDEDYAIYDSFSKFSDCVNYWIKMFMKTDEDMFSYFFSGKKYGKRFDKKYSRLLGGNKFNNPSTLFRGVKFEAVRQYSGVEKRSSEYNDYKFSFVYIPVFINTYTFSNTVYFVKNDTFKFIVGIIFVNTMLGAFNHNIFNGKVDYFNKGFLYAGCKDIILAESDEENNYTLKIETKDERIVIEKVEHTFWDNNFDFNISGGTNRFYMWLDSDKKTIFVSTTESVTKKTDIIGEFNYPNGDSSDADTIEECISEIIELNEEKINYTDIVESTKEKQFKILWNQYYDNYDSTIYGYKLFDYYGYIDCEYTLQDIKIEDNFIEICNNEWEYYDKEYNFGYKVDVSKINFYDGSIKNILNNIGKKDCITDISFYKYDKNSNEPIQIRKFVNKNQKSDKNDILCEILVDLKVGNISIYPKINKNSTYIEMFDEDDRIEDLIIYINIEDEFGNSVKSLGLKKYFSIFEQISMFNISENINNDTNIKYYSTIEDNKYKIRVIEPDSIEVEDVYESVAKNITKYNRSVIGTIDIVPKNDVNKIGIKTINRYTGYYNPIFNDILYYDDFVYSKSIGELEDVKYDLPYSNVYIDYDYEDYYGKFGIIKNMCYHKTNVDSTKNYKILSLEKPIYPAINEYALGYRDYNVFSSNWDDGYFISQDDINNSSICSGIGSMKDGLCMFGSKYLNVPDYIFIDTFKSDIIANERFSASKIKFYEDDDSDNELELLYQEINNKTVKYHLFIKKRLKRYLKEKLIGVFSKYINKDYSFGNKGTIEDDVEEYIENNLLKLYKVDKVYMYTKEDRMRINNNNIDNEYLKYIDKDNDFKIKSGFESISIDNETILKDSKFIMNKSSENEFDRTITYNLKPGFKESFGFGVSFKRK